MEEKHKKEMEELREHYSKVTLIIVFQSFISFLRKMLTLSCHHRQEQSQSLEEKERALRQENEETLADLRSQFEREKQEIREQEEKRMDEELRKQKSELQDEAARDKEAALQAERERLESEKREALERQGSEIESKAEAERERAINEQLKKLQADKDEALRSQEQHLLEQARQEREKIIEEERCKVEKEKDEELRKAREIREKLEQDMGEEKARMSKELEETKEKLQETENRVQSVVAQLDSEKAEVERVRREGREEAERERQKAKEETERVKEEQNRVESLKAELHAVRESAGATEEEQMSRITEVTREKAKLQEELEPLKEEAKKKDERLNDLERQLLDAEETRRKLHNTIQELKGNVRVFCRLRPPKDEVDSVASTDDADPTSVGMLIPPGQGNNQQFKEYSFAFDRVFGERATQEDVFAEVSQLVQSAVDGYKVCLFSYGQTGSGKTHTMLGDTSGENRGIIPRSVERVMETARQQRARGWEFSMEASYIEIYNEQVRDLLKAGSVHSEKHTIVSDGSGCPTVSGAEREPVESVEDAAGLVRRAAAARAVEATQLNSHSSRSHTLFMLYITGTHESANQQLEGCLVLVDLAGSERVERSGAEGARLKEACSINKSLSCLSDVFSAIAQRSPHVPYRNSKLTHLLQPCLGGDGKTLMFVNINPETASAEESLNSLRFASKVNAVELGGPGAKRNVKSLDSRRSSTAPDRDKRKSTAPPPDSRRATFSVSKRQRRN